MIQKKLSVIAIVSVALASTSSFALDITNGQLLQHKEWTIGKVLKASQKEMPQNKRLQQLLNASQKQAANPQNTDEILALAYVPDVIVTENQPITVAGDSGIDVVNHSTKKMNYTLQSSLCVFTSLGILDCTKSEDEISLNAGGHYGKDNWISLTFELSGDCSDNIELDLTSFLTNTIYRNGAPIYTTAGFGIIRFCAPDTVKLGLDPMFP